jgi:acetyl esterase/lipase
MTTILQFFAISFVKNVPRMNNVASKLPEVHLQKVFVSEASIHYEYYSTTSVLEPVSSERPLVVFLHGGAWKAGNSRMHYQVPFLAYLLKNKVDVISCNYRKNEWPNPLVDVVATFRQIQEQFPHRRLVFCGSSAGGHLSILGYYYSRFNKEESKNHKMLLFYPAIDVLNQLQSRQPLLFNDRSILGKPQPPYTLLNRFFETFVASTQHPSNETFPWISPLQLFLPEAYTEEQWKEWPETFVAHGRNDAITLFQASEFFVQELNKKSGQPSNQMQPSKHILLPVKGSHNFDIPDCPQTKEVYEKMLDWINK